MGKSVIRESRALSARRALWQSAALACGALLPAVALAVPGGQIATLEPGSYTCELPGSADGPAGRHVPSADFEIISASSYKADGRIGSYLLTGDQAVFTSGPRKGAKYHRVSRGFLRLLGPDGSDSNMRCVLAGR